MAESIYGLIPAPAFEPERPPMHKSKYPHDTPPSASTFGASAAGQTLTSNISGSYFLSNGSGHRHRSSSATFGPPLDHYSDPTAFLRKGTMPVLPPPKRFVYTDSHKPLVVQTLSQTKNTNNYNNNNNNNSDSSNNDIDNGSSKVSGLVSPNKKQKNFITENALAVIMADARKPSSKVLDYLSKEDYGKVPSYLEKVKNEIEREREYIKSVISKDKQNKLKNQPKLTLLPEQERLQLLSDLKNRWEVVNRDYQGMTHLVVLDTHGKQRRKEEYEAHLIFLEKSIEKLSKSHVYVKEDNHHSSSNEYGY